MLPLLVALLLAQSDEVELGDLQGLAQLQQAPRERDLQRLVDETLPRVSRIMGLPPPPKINLRVISREEASRKLLDVLRREYPGDRLQRLGAALKLIRLVEPEVDLETAAHALYAEHASGFYDPHDHALYLLKDQPMLAQAMIVPHELAHAVQDEKLNLEKTVRAQMGSEDGQLALAAALEGNAQAVATALLTSSLESEGGLASEMLNEAMAASAGAAAANAPPWLVLQMSFPYAAGAQLVKAISTSTDVAGTRLLSRPPASTAQVLDSALYRKDERPLTGTIGLARLVPGSSPLYETTLGRANLDLLGTVHHWATPAGAGWRGDRLEAIRFDGSDAAAWSVVFAEPGRAEDFATRYSALIGARSAGSRFQSREDSKRVSIVSHRGSVVVILIHVPAELASAIEANGFATFAGQQH